ncbi:unnamed protein product [Polarella glacialis]|nr:unnamed protein product [Polarella glacialis]
MAAPVPVEQLAPMDLEDQNDANRLARRIEAVLRRRTGRVLVVLERLCNGHNYSAVLRTCEALGIQHVWLIEPPEGDDLFEAAKLRRFRHQQAFVSDQAAKEAVRQPSDASVQVGSRRWRRLEEAKTGWTEDASMDEHHASAARGAARFLSIREFASTSECIEALRADERTIWATDLAQGAEVLAFGAPWLQSGSSMPPRLALVLGTESTGVSTEMLSAADQRIYLPQNGFSDSLNVSVASALALQTLLLLYGPLACGDLMNESPAEEIATLRDKWASEVARDEAMLEHVRAALASGVKPLDDIRRCDAFRAHAGRTRAERRLLHRQSKEASQCTLEPKL